MSTLTTAIVESYSLGLSFGSPDVSAGEAITFLDPLTSINLALIGDGNGNWKATISCPYPDTRYYENQSFEVGQTAPIGLINGTYYSVAFSNEEGKRIFEAISVTIIGHPGTN